MYELDLLNVKMTSWLMESMKTKCQLKSQRKFENDLKKKKHPMIFDIASIEILSTCIFLLQNKKTLFSRWFLNLKFF